MKIGPSSPVPSSSLLEPWTDGARFNADRSVLVHELGHITTWLTAGYDVVHLRMHRCRDGLLMAAAGFPIETAVTSTYQIAMAERLLAAESAVRRLLGLPRDRIYAELSPEDCEADIAVITSRLDEREDVAKAMKLAADAAGAHWRNWLRERLDHAILIVDSNWIAIEPVARSLRREVPRRVGDSRIISGDDLKSQLDRATSGSTE